MAGLKPVLVTKAAFNFCKYSMATLLWISLIFNSEALVILAFMILVISALVKVQKSPFVQLYIHTFGKVFKSEEVVIEENSIWFAHTVGAVFTGLGILIFQFSNPLIGWGVIGLLAFMKTIASFGFCGAAKLYTCITNPEGKCCRVGKASKKCIVK
jgi:hypothetical protein